MPHSLLLIKLAVAVAMVLGLSIVSERVSPRVAGLLSGFPTGSAITLFFFCIQAGPDFAARSAVFNLAGLASMVLFIYVYYQVSSRTESILLSSAAALASYAVCISLIHCFHFNRISAVLLPTAAAAAGLILMRKIENVKIAERVKLKPVVLLLRALAAASIILAVTAAPGLVGPSWAGLFSAFPSTLFPLILILHVTYGKSAVHTVIKNVPAGLFSLILYSLTVSFTYPCFGAAVGTLLSFAAAGAWLALLQIIRSLPAGCSARRNQ